MLKVGIIGAGRIGKVHCQSIGFIKDAKVSAIADPMMNEEIKKWARNYCIDNTYLDYHKILDDKDIQAVLICSSTDTHCKISLEAIEAGKHVFCEKPIDHSVERILAIKEALKKSNVKYQVGFNRRFDHNFAAAQKAVASGKIGELNILKITSRDPAPPPINYIACSGGLFLDMTIHDFDMVRFMSGAEVEEVYALGGVMVDRAIGEAGDIDTAVVTMKLSNGAFAVIDNCRRSSYGYDQRVEAFGSDGQVAISNDSASSAVISNAEGVTAEKPLLFFLERYMQAYASEIAHFIEAIKTDTDVMVNVDDGLAPVLIGLAAKRSLVEKRPVKLCEIKSQYGI